MNGKRPVMLDRSYEHTLLGPDVLEYLVWKDDVMEGTIEDYRRVLARMCKLVNRRAREVTRADMRRVLGEFPKGSRGYARSVLNGFWTWQRLEKRVVESPMDGISKQRRNRPRVYDVFTEGEEAAIITAGPDTRYGRGVQVRDKACLLVQLRTGLRVGELRALTVRDVDLAERWIIVRNGKGGKPRVVPVRGEVVRALEEFMLTELPRLGRTPVAEDHLLYRVNTTGSSLLITNSGPVFQGEHLIRFVDTSKPVAQSTAWRWWAGCLQRAGVAHRKPHMSRHTYATKLLRMGDGDIAAVGKALGHASLSSTAVYLHAEVADVAEVVERMEAARVEA